MISRLKRLWTLDRVLASGVALSCGGILVDAWREGQTPLEGQLPALQCHEKGRKRLTITAQQCRQLEQKGYLIVDNFISPQEVNQVLRSVRQRTADFDISPNEKVDSSASSSNTHYDQVRNDRVCLFQPSNDQPKLGTTSSNDNKDDSSRSVSTLYDVRNSLHRVGYDIATSPFEGFDAQNNDEVSISKHEQQQQWLGVPSMMQVALYEPRRQQVKEGEEEQVIGGFYRAHTDTCSQSFSELGLLGFLRSKYLRKRYLTCILYLNEDWSPSNGGCLRIFGSNDGDHNENVDYNNGSHPNVIDVEPLAGRLVIFSSSLTHAVLPTFTERVACSIWITKN
eukprot:scaffold1889_cov198-Amphora_coffeaeformis.AAC.8